MSIEWIQYAGRRILHVDYRDCRTQDDMIAQLDEVTRMVGGESGTLLALTNLEGCGIGPEFMDKAKHYAKDVWVKKDARHAIVGITGLTKILLHGYLTFSGSQHTKPCATEDEAKAWLTG